MKPSFLFPFLIGALFSMSLYFVWSEFFSFPSIEYHSIWGWIEIMMGLILLALVALTPEKVFSSRRTPEFRLFFFCLIFLAYVSTSGLLVGEHWRGHWGPVLVALITVSWDRIPLVFVLGFSFVTDLTVPATVYFFHVLEEPFSIFVWSPLYSLGLLFAFTYILWKKDHIDQLYVWISGALCLVLAMEAVPVLATRAGLVPWALADRVGKSEKHSTEKIAKETLALFGTTGIENPESFLKAHENWTIERFLPAYTTIVEEKHPPAAWAMAYGSFILIDKNNKPSLSPGAFTIVACPEARKEARCRPIAWILEPDIARKDLRLPVKLERGFESCGREAHGGHTGNCVPYTFEIWRMNNEN